jgi:hypothetical protein
MMVKIMDRTETLLREILKAVAAMDYDALLKAESNAKTYLRELDDIRKIHEDANKRHT